MAAWVDILRSRGGFNSASWSSADLLVVQQRRVPTMQTVQKTVEIPQVLFLVIVVEIMHRQVPAVLRDRWRCLNHFIDRVYGGLAAGVRVFAAFCGFFQTPSSWTLSPGCQRTFLTSRWPTVVVSGTLGV